MLLHPTPIRLSYPNPIMHKKRTRETHIHGPSKRMRTTPLSTISPNTTTVYVQSKEQPQYPCKQHPYSSLSKQQYKESYNLYSKNNHNYYQNVMPVLHLSYWSWMCFNPYILELSKDHIQEQYITSHPFHIPQLINISFHARLLRMSHLLSQIASFLSYNETIIWSITCHHMTNWINAKYTPTLQHLVCTRIPPNNILTRTPQIQSLQLRDDACQISDTHMQSILSQPIPIRLQHINLNRCIRLSDASLRMLCQRVPRMTVLSLNNCPLITDHVMIYLSKCHKLTCLSLSGNNQLTGITLLHLSKCYKLRVLNASYMNLTDNDLMITQYWPHLRHLSLSHCTRLSVITLLQLINSNPYLLTLDISYLLLLNNSHLRLIAGFVQLMSICIRGTNTTPDGWNYLRYIKPNLRFA